MIPKSENEEALSFEHRVSNAIVFHLRLFRMPATIEFNDDHPIEADEVQIVAAQRMLPSDMKSTRAQAFQAAP